MIGDVAIGWRNLRLIETYSYPNLILLVGHLGVNTAEIDWR